VARCPSCGSENPDDARFCASCGTSLISGCPQCGAEVPDGARFCPSCGTRLQPADHVPTGQERRLVSILFADVTGSTELGERLDAERLQAVFGMYFAAMREEIEAEGGTIEKFIGDAIMAAFGVPVAHEDDPARAVRAALRMRRRLPALNADLEARFGLSLEIRIGINTGEVLAATDPRPGEPMVTGDAVNVAARLEQSAEPGEVVVAERTARAARTFRFRELGERELRGKQHSVPAVLLESEAGAGTERGIPGLHAPMVGRDQELALLRTLYDRVVTESRPALVTVYGEPGVGKSRLTQEFVAPLASGASGAEPVVVRGRCLPYGDGVTYWPLAEILKSLARVRDSDPPETTLARIRGFGAEHLTEAFATDPRKATAALAYTVGVQDPEFPFTHAEPREVRAKIHAAWRSLFSSLAERSPVVAIVEDIHWGDPALLDLLDELAERVVGPVLFLCPARPQLIERRPAWGGGRRNVSSVALEPLSEEEADRLVSLLLAVEDLPEAVHRRILERAEGNPFFLEEIIRHLIDEGRIVREGGRWRATQEVASVEIPDTVQAVLAARIDLLDPVQKRALQRAAVVGRVFWPGPVERLLNGDRERLRETLERLEERELVLSRLASSIAGEPEFIFKHILTREVAYESLPRRDRAASHALVARWIEETAGERAGEFVDLLAYHYVEAVRAMPEDADRAEVERLRGRAVGSLLAASDAARRRFAMERALKLAQKALGLAVEPIDRALALEQVGVVAIGDYRGDLAWRSLREAADIRLAHAPDDERAIARVCAIAVNPPTRWPGSMREHPAEDEVQRYVEIGMAHVRDEETEENVMLLMAKAFGPFSIGPGRPLRPGEAEEALAAGRRGADIAERIGRLDLTSAALDGACSVPVTQGRYGDARPLIERRLALAERIEEPWELGDIFAMGGWHFFYVGDYRRSLELAERGIRATAVEAEGLELHNRSWAAASSFALGRWDRVMDDLLPHVERALGDREPPYFIAPLYGAAAAIAAIRRDPSQSRLRDLVERQAGTVAGGTIHLSIWRAWLLARDGAVDEAFEQIEAVEAAPSKIARPLTEQLHASLFAESGRLDSARAFLERSRSYAAEAGVVALPIHLDRLEALVRMRQGDDGGLDQLRDAREGLDGLGARWEVARTDLWLAEELGRRGVTDEARERLAQAERVFDELRSVSELERARELEKELG